MIMHIAVVHVMAGLVVWELFDSIMLTDEFL